MSPEPEITRDHLERAYERLTSIAEEEVTDDEQVAAVTAGSIAAMDRIAHGRIDAAAMAALIVERVAPDGMRTQELAQVMFPEIADETHAIAALGTGYMVGIVMGIVATEIAKEEQE